MCLEDKILEYTNRQDKTSSTDFWSLVELAVAEFSLLKHSFYQAWQRGELKLDDLRVYAKEYYSLESALPRFLSRVHSAIEDPRLRVEVLKNLISEEGEATTHRELWEEFGKALGIDERQMRQHQTSVATREVLDSLLELCSQQQWHCGIAALYAYESQQPEVAKTKRKGLVQFYGFLPTASALKFFEVHEEADLWHSQAEKEILMKWAKNIHQQEKIVQSAQRAAQLLWKFLDGVCLQIGLPTETNLVCSLN